MKDKNELLSIAEAGKKFRWSVRTQIHLVRTYLRIHWERREKESQEAESNIDAWRSFCESLYAIPEMKRRTTEIRLEDLLRVCDFSNYELRNSMPSLRRTLVHAGATVLDSFRFQHVPVSVATLQQLGKENLLKQDLAVLNTISAYTLNNEWRSRKETDQSAGRYTIGDLLQMSEFFWGAKGRSKTFVILKQLGFGPSDGPFMQFDPRTRWEERLMKEHRLSRRRAREFVAIAVRHNWV